MSGAASYHAGQAAEEAVARQYERAGATVVARRWRSAAGEIDLIARDGETVIFIEVKQSRSHDRAATHLSGRQMDRIYTSAAIFLGDQPNGLDTDCRFDVALVDETGAIRIIENAFTA